jgi:hypothetical protein
MKKRFGILSLFFAVAVFGLLLPQPAPGAPQGSTTQKTNTRILYHNGPVMRSAVHIYIIYYGCWNCNFPGSNLDTQIILGNLASSLGLSPYFRINTTYPDYSGSAPNGAVVFGGAVEDASYSHGNELTAADIQSIVSDQFTAQTLPQDPAGIFLVVASSDISALATGFCSPGAAPYHGNFTYFGTAARFAFIGNAARCPSLAAPQFVASDGSLLPSPNGNYAADAMASTAAYALNTIVTNPNGNGWYDRYGLENADKCRGKFGQTYTTTNGARANMKLGLRDYLIQQNWVNESKGYCALAYP